mmetsp:Transcript_7387/g.13758  ORF Transcript_7387/g.13758 Transcript_7387/m.13758 type:complete len:83 (-) Transcript_7387:3881-4129(-)
MSTSLAQQDSRVARQLELKQTPKQMSIVYPGSSSLNSTRPVTPENSVLLQDFSFLRKDFRKAYYNSNELLKVRRRQLEMTRH